jgi:replicative superfamily II helicase
VARPKYAHFELRVLGYLMTADMGRAAQVNIQQSLGITKSSLADVIAKLEQKELVTSKGIPLYEGGRTIRTRLVTITQLGRDHFEEVPSRHKQLGIPPPVSKYLEVRKPHIGTFFPLQERFLRRGLLSSKKNVSAFGYPGSGKTLIAEMLMAKVISEGGRCIYLTPYKALDWQKYQDFKASFGGIGARVVINDGDSRVSQGDLAKAHIIIGTYERAYGALRSNERWITAANLVCADEITLLGDEERGGTIDLLLTELPSRSKAQILTLSSLVGNPHEICDWLNSEALIGNMPATEIPISEQLVCRNGDGIDFLSRDGEKKHVQTDLDIIPYLVKQNLGRGLSSLVFVGTRPAATRFAKNLKGFHNLDTELEGTARAFLASQYGPSLLTEKVSGLVPYSISFHHAGLLRETRRFVEDLLRKERLMTVVATTTLSHGVDYAIDSVIIDFEGIESVRRHELESYEYINMKGRAGRPGKSDSASIYIVTEGRFVNKMFNRYFARGTEPLHNAKVITKDRIAELIISAASSGMTLDDVKFVVAKTLSQRYSQPAGQLVKQVFRDLKKMDLVNSEGGLLVATSIGIKLNELHLPPYDYPTVKKVALNTSDQEILALASKIGLAKSVSKRGLLRKADPTVDVLMSWIDETDLDEIQIFNPSGYDDQDIVELGRETSRSLKMMAELLPHMGERLKKLAVRTRFGIKDDLRESELLEMQFFRQRPARDLLRKFSTTGLNSLTQISKLSPDELGKRLQVSNEIAEQLILSSQRAESGSFKRSTTKA